MSYLALRYADPEAPEDAPDEVRGPFATIEQAREEAEDFLASGDEVVRIYTLKSVARKAVSWSDEP